MFYQFFIPAVLLGLLIFVFVFKRDVLLRSQKLKKRLGFSYSSEIKSMKSHTSNGDRLCNIGLSGGKRLIAVADGLSSASKPWVGAQIAVEKLASYKPTDSADLKAVVYVIQDETSKIRSPYDDPNAHTTLAAGIFDEVTKVFSSASLGDSYTIWMSISKAMEYLSEGQSGSATIDDVCGMINLLHCKQGFEHAKKRHGKAPAFLNNGPGMLLCLGGDQAEFNMVVQALEDAQCSPFIDFQCPCEDPLIVTCCDGVLDGLDAAYDWDTAMIKVMALAVACQQQGCEAQFASYLVAMSAGHVAVDEVSKGTFEIVGTLPEDHYLPTGRFLETKLNTYKNTQTLYPKRYGRCENNKTSDDLSAVSIFPVYFTGSL